MTLPNRAAPGMDEADALPSLAPATAGGAGAGGEGKKLKNPQVFAGDSVMVKSNTAPLRLAVVSTTPQDEEDEDEEDEDEEDEEDDEHDPEDGRHEKVTGFSFV